MASNRITRQLRPVLCVVITLVAAAAPTHAAATFSELGDLPGGHVYTVANTVSADGRVVVGFAVSSDEGTEAFWWSQATGMIGLGVPAGSIATEATAVSADGSVVAGFTQAPEGRRAFRWTNDTGMVLLAGLPGRDGRTEPTLLSHDGTIGLGFSEGEDPPRIALQWLGGDRTERLLESGRDAELSVPLGMSADGSVIVGIGNGNPLLSREAIRWDRAEQPVGLGDLPGGVPFSLAAAVSADGSVVVGASGATSGTEPFRWTQSHGLVSLGLLPNGNYHGQAHAVSADGNTVVGFSGGEAFIWEPSHGMRSVRDVLSVEYGLGSELDGWYLNAATGISADGRTIVGYGVNPQGETEAWIATIPEPGTLASAVILLAATAMFSASRRAVLRSRLR